MLVLKMNSRLAFWALASILTGCAGAPPKDPVVYQSTTAVPAVFDLEVFPANDGNYTVDGKELTLKDLYWKIRGSKNSDKPIKTLLLQNDDTNVMQLVCVIAVVDDQNIAGYQKTKGTIRAMKVTGDSKGYQVLTKQCMDSVEAR